MKLCPKCFLTTTQIFGPVLPQATPEVPHSVSETLIPQSGLHTLRSSDHAGQVEGSTRKKIVFLLTDGQPSKGSRPPEGELAALRTYLESYPSFHCQIATFGFGYKLDSELLLELAQEGGGTYAFISDAPMVGNVFTACFTMSRMHNPSLVRIPVLRS